MSASSTSADSSPASYRAPAFIDFQPEWSGKGATPARLEALRETSVVIIDDFVDSPWIPILRDAGRRVTEACRPEKGYSVIDTSKGYVHRTPQNEPWAIRGLIHPLSASLASRIFTAPTRCWNSCRAGVTGFSRRI